MALGSPGIFGIKIPGLTKRIKEVSADNKTGANIFNIYLMIKLVNYNKNIYPHILIENPPLRKSPKPLPAVGFIRNGSLFGSS